MDILLYIILGLMVLAFALNKLQSKDPEEKKPSFSESGDEGRENQFWIQIRWGLGVIVVLSIISMAMERGWI